MEPSRQQPDNDAEPPQGQGQSRGRGRGVAECDAWAGTITPASRGQRAAHRGCARDAGSGRRRGPHRTGRRDCRHGAAAAAVARARGTQRAQIRRVRLALGRFCW